MRCIVPAKYDEEVELWRLPPLGGAGAHRRVFCNIWHTIVGLRCWGADAADRVFDVSGDASCGCRVGLVYSPIMRIVDELIAFSASLAMLLAAIVFVWFISHEVR
jgi:hypothetical protein